MLYALLSAFSNEKMDDEIYRQFVESRRDRGEIRAFMESKIAVGSLRGRSTSPSPNLTKEDSEGMMVCKKNKTVLV